MTYSIAFFAVFSRFFSIVFGEIKLQEETRIASMSGIDKFLITLAALAMLFLILRKCNQIMTLNLKSFGYYVVFECFFNFIAIIVNKLMMIN